MDDAAKLKLALPKGSLNDKERGYTKGILESAGYNVIGYNPGAEDISKLLLGNDLEIELNLFRPQDILRVFRDGDTDIAILGSDLVAELSRSESEPVKLTDLEYGLVDIVFAVPSSWNFDTLTDILTDYNRREEKLKIYTELPNLTRDFLLKNSTYRELYGELPPDMDVRGHDIDGGNKSVEIIFSSGGTEQYLKLGEGYIIVDSVQSGKSIKKADGKKLNDGLIMHSSAGLYVRPDLEKNKLQYNKALQVRDMLVGAVVGKNYVELTFNVLGGIEKLKPIITYIYENKLARKGPTVSKIMNPEAEEIGYGVNIIVPRGIYPMAVNDLRGLGAADLYHTDVRQLIK